MTKKLSSSQWWIVPKIWQDCTAFIIGGGPSLKGFDFSPIHNMNVIGCNDAYNLGDWVDVCYFGDIRWFEIHWKEWVWYTRDDKTPGLQQYGGLIACCNEKFLNKDGSPKYKRVKVLKRFAQGINTLPGCVAWNNCTGGSAINLAINLGCNRVVLLGYDMKLGPQGEGNFHINLKDSPKPSSFERFMRGFNEIKPAAEMLGVEIINCGPDSDLDLWPHRPLKEIIKETQGT